MNTKRFVVCDPERGYSENLIRYFIDTKKSDFQIQLFHDAESLKELSDQDDIEILLIAEEYKGKLDVKAEKIFFLTQNEEKGDSRTVYRYQSGDDIARCIFGKQECKKEPERKEVFHGVREKYPVRRETQRRGLIAIYSPVHRIGKTRFAIQLGRKIAQKVPTLYLNLEDYPASGIYYPEQKEKNLGDLLYYAGQENRNLGIRISTMTGQIENLDYIMPISVAQDLRTVKAEEWLDLFHRILSCSIYETIILDMGDNVDGLYTILKNCSLVYTHYTDDPVSMEKIRRYEENIRMMGMDEILEHTIRRKVVRKNRQITEEKREGTADG